MRIALAVDGTRGDVHPMLALAVRLGERGHQVHCCARRPTSPRTLRERGLAFHPVGVSVRDYLEAQAAFLHGNALAIDPREGRRYFQETLVRQFRELTARRAAAPIG